MSEETKKCPMCGEEILAVAVKCKHCGSDLAEKPTAGTAAPADANENIGYILLLLPIVATVLIWMWIGNMNMLQNPGSSLDIVFFGTIIITAILAAYEANQLGFGKEVGEGKKKENSPAVYFLVVLLLWIVGYPLYLYRRSKNGKKNFLLVGIIVAVILVLSYAMMAGAINERLSEIRNAFG